MASSLVIRPVGATLGLSVTGSSHAAVLLPFSTNDQVNFVNVTNTSATLYVAVTISAGSLASTIPGDGTTGSFVIAPTRSVNLSIPAGAVYVTAIASGAGPTLVTFTAIGDQS